MAEPKLSTYRAKRDFKVTAEPSGDHKVAPADRLRFVIQKHDATRLHYDFRLEHKGVMLSWAVTRGPSLDPADRRLAVEVEPHPLDYGDFEGCIPKGQYGGGTVMLWDRGYWAPEGMTVEEGLKAGDLKFTLDGERLQGSWVLVRMKNDREGGKRTNWLLIKHRDDHAVPGDADALLKDNAASIASGRTMEEIAAGKAPGPKPFITAAPKGSKTRGRAAAAAVWNSNRTDPEASSEAVAVKARSAKVAKGSTVKAIPAFVAPQLCCSVDRPPSGEAWAHEIKFDGYRMQLRVEGGKATLKTRKGLDWTHRFEEIAAEAAALPDCMIDGEAVALDGEGAPDFPALQAALSSGKTGGLVFYVFDLLFLRSEDLRALPLRDRKARLEALVDGEGADAGRLRFVEHFKTGGEAVLSSACRMHLEGIISKRLDAPYVSGRSDNWTKAKCRGGQEVVVAGWTSEGEGQLRSLIAGVHRDGRLVHVGRIGTGYSRSTVDQILPRLKAVETGKSPFEGPGAPQTAAGVHWVKPVLVAEIESGGWTGTGNLRQASFKALREDKPAEEVVQETVAPVETVEGKPQPRNSKASKAEPKPRAPGKKPTGNVVGGIALSNPDKVLWPPADGEPAHTKRDLALYYEAMAEAIMPHIRGRPCSIIRCPDGVGGQGFFQRHVGQGTSALVTSVTVWGDRKPYLQLDRPEALIAMAQTGALELHPWNCLPDQPEVPGRLVFDLDPGPEVPFEAVVAGAHEVRARLEAVGLEAFCKTTGGKGLHVVAKLAPEKAPPTWPEAKGFARDLSTAMAADRPDLYLVNMAKAKRAGRIFLDYLRNDRMATAVAPYSPRARSGAPVSWPLAWKDVKPGLDPKAFNLRTGPDLVGKNKAWADYDASARPLRAAIAKLGKKAAA
ncbi:MAG TPA: DNA ligase D [Caulobacteraceae bacterium]|nr:DNA ligase D [Caulobacteraceae bacterium]